MAAEMCGAVSVTAVSWTPTPKEMAYVMAHCECAGLRWWSDQSRLTSCWSKGTAAGNSNGDLLVPVVCAKYGPQLWDQFQGFAGMGRAGVRKTRGSWKTSGKLGIRQHGRNASYFRTTPVSEGRVLEQRAM